MASTRPSSYQTSYDMYWEPAPWEGQIQTNPSYQPHLLDQNKASPTKSIAQFQILAEIWPFIGEHNSARFSNITKQQILNPFHEPHFGARFI